MSVFTSVGRRPVLAGIAAATLASVLEPGPVRAAGALDRAPKVLVFDVAESLLDLQALRPVFQRLFGNGAVVDEWFGQTILYSETATLTNTFAPFGPLGAGVLRMLGRIHGVPVSDADVAELGRGLGTLPPHPDVPDALRALKAAGFRLYTLTDNTAAISGRQLTHGGLIDLFDRRFSVDDTAKRHKPAPEAYAEVTKELGAQPAEMCLMACHSWDTIGAQAAGWVAGLIQRTGNDVLETAAQPDYVGRDLNAVADQIIARHAPGRG